VEGLSFDQASDPEYIAISWTLPDTFQLFSSLILETIRVIPSPNIPISAKE
jgi:hypothetical protein